MERRQENPHVRRLSYVTWSAPPFSKTAYKVAQPTDRPSVGGCCCSPTLQSIVCVCVIHKRVGGFFFFWTEKREERIFPSPAAMYPWDYEGGGGIVVNTAHVLIVTLTAAMATAVPRWAHWIASPPPCSLSTQRGWMQLYAVTTRTSTSVRRRLFRTRLANDNGFNQSHVTTNFDAKIANPCLLFFCLTWLGARKRHLISQRRAEVLLSKDLLVRSTFFQEKRRAVDAAAAAAAAAENVLESNKKSSLYVLHPIIFIFIIGDTTRKE